MLFVIQRLKCKRKNANVSCFKHILIKSNLREKQLYEKNKEQIYLLIQNLTFKFNLKKFPAFLRNRYYFD